jgi:hypothetical protein
MLFQLLLGSSKTHSLLRNLPFVYQEIGPRNVARLTALSREIDHRNSDGQRSTSGDFYSRRRVFTYKSPSTKTPIYRLHATCTPLDLRGPTLPRQLRDFAVREPMTPKFLLPESPNAGVPILWIRATCPHSDRRFRLNRGIALRDFDVHGIIALAHPDLPICDAEGFFLHSKANLLAPPESNDPRDFPIFLDNFKSSVLFLYKEISAPPPPFCVTSTGVNSTMNQRTIPSEISRTHSPCSFFNTFPKVMKSFGSLGTHARKDAAFSSELTTEAPRPTCTHLHDWDNFQLTWATESKILTA